MQDELKAIFGKKGNNDDKSLDFLTKALAKNNLKGFDYLEYKLSLGRLAEMGIEDDIIYKSAFATATTVGLTKEKLIASARHYKEVLRKEKEQFDLALENQLNKRVKSKRAEVDKLKKQIAAWEEQIKKLQTQIVQSQATINNADQHIQAEMAKIENTKVHFESTHQNVLSQIDEDLEKIQKLPG
ncbi:MAG TPA: hypothetical protein ENJ20_01550 [Bacteroidetes bacterium]|nr:hypothetical protein [Bacteroidota bacterium]